MSDEPTKTDDAIQEELTAYLDGELDESSSHQVEGRLSEDDAYRLQLQQLERAWNLLDNLPRAQASDGFTQSTVEMVAVVADDNVKQAKRRQTGRRRAAWLAAVAAAVVCAVAGYFVVAYWADAENRQLVRDLPVIENVDLYSQVESVEFLRLLDQESLFPEEVETIEDELP